MLKYYFKTKDQWSKSVCADLDCPAACHLRVGYQTASPPTQPSGHCLRAPDPGGLKRHTWIHTIGFLHLVGLNVDFNMNRVWCIKGLHCTL